MAAWAGNADNLRASSVKTAIKNTGIKCVSKLLYTGRHFWNRKCRKKTWWQQEFAVFKCEATANSVTGNVCVYSNCGLVAVRAYVPSNSLHDVDNV